LRKIIEEKKREREGEGGTSGRASEEE